MTPLLRISTLSAAIAVLTVGGTGAWGQAIQPPQGRLTNLSARAAVGTGNNILIVGFVISGSATKQVLLRGVGPGLNATFPGSFQPGETLASPTLNLINMSGGTVATNTSWGGAATLASLFTQVGAFSLQANSADAAVLQTLGGVGGNSYTSQVSGANNTTGIALAEIYDADPGPPKSQLSNISARADVGTGDGILIGGFFIAGGPETVLVRAVGPGLTSTFNLTGVLAQPVLTLLDGSSHVVATNAGWGNAVTTGNSAVAASAAVQPASAAIMTQAGAFSLGARSADSAMVATLPPGSYTAQVSGAGGTTGIALVEVYQVP